jgi:hypothetical protein
MAELTPADVETYTAGRLSAADPLTQLRLDAALAAARRYCGWHVTPVIEDDDILMDGPAGALLNLPTLRLVELTAMTEQGVDVDLDFVHASQLGLVRKKVGYPTAVAGSEDWWNWIEYANPTVYPYFNYDTELWWTGGYSTIEVTMTHGYDDAPEWQAAVLSYLNRSAINPSGLEETIGPFRYTATTTVAGTAFTPTEIMLLDLYKLAPSA